jgi:hypothetical protein
VAAEQHPADPQHGAAVLGHDPLERVVAPHAR